jgi:hypothetical protein
MAMNAKMEKHRGGGVLVGASRGPSGGGSLFGASVQSDLFDFDCSSQREVV